MHRNTLVFSFVLGLLGCGDDDGAEPGTELGPCVQEQFCESTLQCIEGICVDPNQAGDGATGNQDGDGPIGDGGPVGGDTSQGGADGDSMPADSGAPSTTGGDGAEVYCSTDPEACWCGHTADYGPPGTACSEATVSSPGLCCASEGWPAYGGCSCWTHSCRIVSFDTCVCAIGSPSEDTEPTDSCSPGAEGVCCLDGDGGSCSCHQNLSQCLEGDIEVGSCSVANITCGDSNHVSACN